MHFGFSIKQNATTITRATTTALAPAPVPAVGPIGNSEWVPFIFCGHSSRITSYLRFPQIVLVFFYVDAVRLKLAYLGKGLGWLTHSVKVRKWSQASSSLASSSLSWPSSTTSSAALWNIFFLSLADQTRNLKLSLLPYRMWHAPHARFHSTCLVGWMAG